MNMETRRTRNRLWIGSIALVSVLVGMLHYALGTEDDHRTNVRYLAWKYGRAPQDYKWCLHLAFVDSDLQGKLKDKPIDELNKWFPNAEPPKPGSWQSDWLSSQRPDSKVSYRVIGDSNVAIFLRNEKFDHLFAMKG